MFDIICFDEGHLLSLVHVSVAWCEQRKLKLSLEQRCWTSVALILSGLMRNGIVI